jgi:chromate transporter
MADPDASARAPKSAGELFRIFTRLALQGFGGVLPVAQRELVERQHWLTREQFVELLSLSQVLPGPNVINLSLMFGDRHFGWRGAVAATGGLLAVPLAIVLAATLAYQSFADVPAVAGALRGMGAVAAGLVVGTAVKLAGTLKATPLGRPVAALLVVLTATAVGVARWPMAWVVLGLGLLALAWAAYRLRQPPVASEPHG